MKPKSKQNRFPLYFLLTVVLIAGLWLLNKTWSGNKLEAHSKPTAKEGNRRFVKNHKNQNPDSEKDSDFFSLEKAKKSTQEFAENLERKIRSVKVKQDKPGKKGRWDYLENIPGFGYPNSTEKGNQIVRHTAYTLSYSNVYEQALWVAYKLSADNLQGPAGREHEQFHDDPNVKLGSALPSDYSGSGYDRGHLAPAGDMRHNETTMHESFYMSNVSPQKPACNRGIWKDLEERVRKWAKRDKQFYIVTGPIINKNHYEVIGKNKENQVAIPESFYKVVLDLREPEIKEIAFIVPNEGSEEDVRFFAVSVDEAEKATGLDFFRKCPIRLKMRWKAR